MTQTRGSGVIPLNGFLTRSTGRSSPWNDIDHEPKAFRRYVDASGAQTVMIGNGLGRRTAAGLRVPFVTYLYAAVPEMPRQDRLDYGGTQKRGIGPFQFRNLFRATAGMQPSDPGGIQSRAIMGDNIINPMTSLS